mmetsp:Transcript_487/g.678  ORF Transcript_487/g.678 Transcript_487/m.678 type:complete len:320 (+) Transcript_487:93-1052(+)
MMMMMMKQHHTQQCSYIDILNDIIQDDKVKSDIALLKQVYIQRGYASRWQNALKDYVQYLIVHLVSQKIKINTLPPLHVDALWSIHLVETESYRGLEKMVIRKVKEKDNYMNLDLKIDHSSLLNNNDRQERLGVTQYLYSLIGFEFPDDFKDEYENTADDKKRNMVHTIYAIDEDDDDDEDEDDDDETDEIPERGVKRQRKASDQLNKTNNKKSRRSKESIKADRNDIADKQNVVTLRFCDFTGGLYCIQEINRESNMEIAVRVVANQLGVEVETLKLDINGEHFSPILYTPNDLKLKDQDQITVFIDECIGIEASIVM